jgi:hypothetical protein
MRYIDKPTDIKEANDWELRLPHAQLNEKQVSRPTNFTTAYNNSNKQFEFNNCFFSEKIIIENKSWPILEISNCYFTDLEINNNTGSRITFNNCTIQNLVINSENHGLNLSFSSSQDYIDSFVLNVFIKMQNGSIVLNTAYFEELKIETKSMVNIKVLNSNSNLKNNHKERFEVVKHETFGDVSERIDNKRIIEVIGTVDILKIYNSLLDTALVKNESKCNLEIDDSEIIEDLIVLSNSIDKFKIYSTKIKTLNIEATSLQILEIKNDFYGSLSLKVQNINYIKISKSNKKDFIISSINFDACNIQLSFIIECCEIENIYLNEFNNLNGKFYLKNSYIRKGFKMINSDIGESIFSNVNFDKNLSFTFLNTNIIKSKFLTVDWMDNHRLNEELPSINLSNQDKLQHYLTVKESYRQLKEISLKALNRYDALNFQRNEQRMYKEILWIKKNYLDHFLLKTNDLFNDFGLSYIKPLLWLLSSHLVLFCLVMFFGDNVLPYSFSLFSGTFSWGDTLNAFSQYFQTLIPIHSADYLDGELGFPLIIDVLMRISSGYFLYYLISASRKFHINS